MGVGLSVLRSVKLVGYFVRFGGELLLRRPEARTDRAEWLHRFCSTALKGLGVNLCVSGNFPKRGALISNHLSYVDIVVYAAISPCVFCSKAEIEHWPVVGWLATMAGTVFVARGKGGSAAKAGVGMKAAAKAGLPVVFFPEGTTTNGREMLPFHSGLLAQAMQTEEPVSAAYVRYSLEEENESGASVEDDICYWGDRSMRPHVFRFLGLRGVRADVTFGEGPIRFSADVLHRKIAALEARSAVLRLSDMHVAEDSYASMSEAR